MDYIFPRWPDMNGEQANIRKFRREALEAPLVLEKGFDAKATQALFRELLPGAGAPPAHKQDWPWFWRVPSKSDRAIAGQVRRLIAQGADPSFRVETQQGCFMPLGLAAWLGLEQTVQVLLESGARVTWFDSKKCLSDEAMESREDIMANETQDQASSTYEGIPSDPLVAATQALGVAIESQSEIAAGALDRSIRIARRLGEAASPFRADPMMGRNPIEELFVQIDYMSEGTPCPQEVADLLWGWTRTHVPADKLKEVVQKGPDNFSIPGASDPVPRMFLEALEARGREWLMDQEIQAPEPAPQSVSRSPRF